MKLAVSICRNRGSRPHLYPITANGLAGEFDLAEHLMSRRLGTGDRLLASGCPILDSGKSLEALQLRRPYGTAEQLPKHSAMPLRGDALSCRAELRPMIEVSGKLGD